MNTMYNKTALKKIKKDDLVQMYLDLQAKNYDDKMEDVLEKCCNNAIDETVEELQKENKKLQEENEGFKSICNEYLDGPEASWQDLSNWCENKTDEITCLESDSMNEVSQLQFDETVKDLKEENEMLENLFQGQKKLFQEQQKLSEMNEKLVQKLKQQLKTNQN